MVRSGGRHLLRKCSWAERPWGGDIGVEGSDTNSYHVGVEGGGGARCMWRDQMISREWLVSLIYDLTIGWRWVSKYAEAETRSVVEEEAKNGVARIASFVDFRKEKKGVCWVWD